MSANDHTTAHEEAHTGPIKTPKQLLATVFFSFVVPVFALSGWFITSPRPINPWLAPMTLNGLWQSASRKSAWLKFAMPTVP